MAAVKPPFDDAEVKHQEVALVTSRCPLRLRQTVGHLKEARQVQQLKNLRLIQLHPALCRMPLQLIQPRANQCIVSKSDLQKPSLCSSLDGSSSLHDVI